MLKQGVDVVVGTPGRINELMAKGALQLKRCCGAVVLDEVDILLGATLYGSTPRALNECYADQHEADWARAGQRSCVPMTSSDK